MNVIDYITITCNLKYVRLHEKCNRLHITITPCLPAAGQRFSRRTQVSSINRTERHDITELLLKVVLNTIALIRIHIYIYYQESSTKYPVKLINESWEHF